MGMLTEVEVGIGTIPLCHTKTHALQTKPKNSKPIQTKPKPPQTNMLQHFKECSSVSSASLLWKRRNRSGLGHLLE